MSKRYRPVLRDLRLSQWCYWGLKSPGVWGCAVEWGVSYVSKVHVPWSRSRRSIPLGPIDHAIEGATIIRKVGNHWAKTQRCIAEQVHPIDIHVMREILCTKSHFWDKWDSHMQSSCYIAPVRAKIKLIGQSSLQVILNFTTNFEHKTDSPCRSGYRVFVYLLRLNDAEKGEVAVEK